MINRGSIKYLFLTIILIIAVFLFYSSYRLAAAEYNFTQSLKEAAKNRGDTTFALQKEAIRLNPFEPRYRVVFSQTNLALASALAAKKEISDQERTQIKGLIQQSIQEAKAAVALNRLNVNYWLNLANIYQNLIGVATGADRWSVATYQQAVSLDPNNPQLRLLYGQLLYGLAQQEAAKDQFKTAVALKPDLANAHYNLAVVYKEDEKWLLAKAEYEQALSLVETNSADYKKVKNELEEVNTNLKEVQESSQRKLINQDETLPEATQEASSEAILKPPFELPEEAAPELTITPSVSPTSGL